jgi:hypothetical protein
VQLHEEREHVFDEFRKYHTKLLRQFNTKVAKEDIFEPTFGNENLYEISCELVTSENLIVMSTVFSVAASINSLGHILKERQKVRLIKF